MNDTARMAELHAQGRLVQGFSFQISPRSWQTQDFLNFVEREWNYLLTTIN